MTDKFTPGPWRVVKSDGTIVVCTESEKKTEFGASRYAAIGGFDRSDKAQCEEALANAALIAAAPELLQAAVAALELLKVIHDETGKVGMQLQTAIAKARGL